MARRATLNAPVRLVSITSRQSSSFMRTSNVSRATPAFDTTTVARPNSASILPNASSTAAASATSHVKHGNSSVVDDLDSTATRSPSAAKARAQASPIPRVPPVHARTTRRRRRTLVDHGASEPSIRRVPPQDRGGPCHAGAEADEHDEVAGGEAVVLDGVDEREGDRRRRRVARVLEHERGPFHGKTELGVRRLDDADVRLVRHDERDVVRPSRLLDPSPACPSRSSPARRGGTPRGLPCGGSRRCRHRGSSEPSRRTRDPNRAGGCPCRNRPRPQTTTAPAPSANSTAVERSSQSMMRDNVSDPISSTWSTDPPATNWCAVTKP